MYFITVIFLIVVWCFDVLIFSRFAVQETESVGHVVFIHDLSSNGTFLNGTKIGMTQHCFVGCYLLM